MEVEKGIIIYFGSLVEDFMGFLEVSQRRFNYGLVFVSYFSLEIIIAILLVTFRLSREYYSFQNIDPSFLHLSSPTII